jgi:hypothetical protein
MLYFFGNDEKDLCRHGNGLDQTGLSWPRRHLAAGRH